MTRSELHRTIARAELTAVLLRLKGFHKLGQTERTRIADDLETLAQIARRAFDTETLDIRRLQYDQTDDATDAAPRAAPRCRRG